MYGGYKVDPTRKLLKRVQKAVDDIVNYIHVLTKARSTNPNKGSQTL